MQLHSQDAWSPIHALPPGSFHSPPSSQGMGACLMRDVPFNAMYFSSYGAFKDALKPADDAPLSPQVGGEGGGLPSRLWGEGGAEVCLQ